MEKEKDSNGRIILFDNFREPVANRKLSQEEQRRLDYQTLLKEINAFGISLEANKADAKKEQMEFKEIDNKILQLDLVIYEAIKNHDIAVSIDESGSIELTVKDGIVDYEKLSGFIAKRPDLVKEKALKAAILKTTHLVIKSEESMLELFRMQLKEFREDKVFTESLQTYAYEAVKNVAEAEKLSFGHATSDEMSFGEKVKAFFCNVKDKIASFRKK